MLILTLCLQPTATILAFSLPAKDDALMTLHTFGKGNKQGGPRTRLGWFQHPLVTSQEAQF